MSGSLASAESRAELKAIQKSLTLLLNSTILNEVTFDLISDQLAYTDVPRILQKIHRFAY